MVAGSGTRRLHFNRCMIFKFNETSKHSHFNAITLSEVPFDWFYNPNLILNCKNITIRIELGLRFASLSYKYVRAVFS